jgi:hypothetical protein
MLKLIQPLLLNLSFERSYRKPYHQRNYKTCNLDVDFNGINVDPWGNTKAGFSFEGKINRKDFGLNWNAALEAGGVMVSDDVKFAGELQFVKQA